MTLTLQISFADPTLTVDNLIGVMNEVTSDKERRRKVWRKVLKWGYGSVPGSYIDEVYSKSTSDEATHTLADVYVNSRPESSWQDLLQTLYWEGEMAAAKEAKSFIPHNGGWYYTCKHRVHFNPYHVSIVHQASCGSHYIVLWFIKF